MKPLDFKPQDLHEWYLEATTKISKCSYNKKAQKPYEELSEEQKFIDKFVCKKIKQRIREACDFYLRYKDNPKLLVKEHPEYREETERIIPEVRIFDGIGNIPSLKKYNEWLFKLAFKSVLEEKE